MENNVINEEKKYIFKNGYDKQTTFVFNEKNMKIEEVWIGDQLRTYLFKYDDINKYTIIPNRHGIYELSFWSNENSIVIDDAGKQKNVSLVTIKIKTEMNDTPIYNLEIFYNNVNDVRNVIYLNTPLRSEMDLIQEKANKIFDTYKNTNDSDFGMIYINGLKKEWSEYHIQINKVVIFTKFTSKQEQKLKNNNQFVDSIAQPEWIDNSTLAFKIPYGDWFISFTAPNTVYSSVDAHGIDYTDGPEGINITVNENHKEVKLKIKKGLFKSKLVEL